MAASTPWVPSGHARKFVGACAAQAAPRCVLLGQYTTRYPSLVGLAMHPPGRRRTLDGLPGATTSAVSEHVSEQYFPFVQRADFPRYLTAEGLAAWVGFHPNPNHLSGWLRHSEVNGGTKRCSLRKPDRARTAPACRLVEHCVDTSDPDAELGHAAARIVIGHPDGRLASEIELSRGQKRFQPLARCAAEAGSTLYEDKMDDAVELDLDAVPARPDASERVRQGHFQGNNTIENAEFQRLTYAGDFDESFLIPALSYMPSDTARGITAELTAEHFESRDGPRIVRAGDESALFDVRQIGKSTQCVDQALVECPPVLLHALIRNQCGGVSAWKDDSHPIYGRKGRTEGWGIGRCLGSD
jgi:hypothetical protein